MRKGRSLKPTPRKRFGDVPQDPIVRAWREINRSPRPPVTTRESRIAVLACKFPPFVGVDLSKDPKPNGIEARNRRAPMPPISERAGELDPDELLLAGRPAVRLRTARRADERQSPRRPRRVDAERWHARSQRRRAATACMGHRQPRVPGRPWSPDRQFGAASVPGFDLLDGRGKRAGATQSENLTWGCFTRRSAPGSV